MALPVPVNPLENARKSLETTLGFDSYAHVGVVSVEAVAEQVPSHVRCALPKGIKFVSDGYLKVTYLGDKPERMQTYMCFAIMYEKI